MTIHGGFCPFFLLFVFCFNSSSQADFGEFIFPFFLLPAPSSSLAPSQIPFRWANTLHQLGYFGYFGYFGYYSLMFIVSLGQYLVQQGLHFIF